MVEFRQLQEELTSSLDRTGLPRRLLRHLILCHGLGVGSYVLDVGCGSGELLHYMDELGIKASGFDESAESVAEARRRTPRLDLLTGALDATLLPEQCFHLVIVRFASCYAGTLFCEEALRTTGCLLSTVRPGGSLVFLASPGPVAETGRLRHESSCFLRHLSAFPGTADSIDFRAVSRWKRLFTARSPAEMVLVSLRIPAEPLNRRQWLKASAESTLHHGSCCFLAKPRTPPQRAAA